eukprot:GHVU01213586.1.p1 GENE.GHVU01213586.1~~GHVU01213586.1.p1  ORF type:complete len:130 (-),score=2.34 GHVU01213586.1:21-410(-)
MAAARMPSITTFFRPTPGRAPQVPTNTSVVAGESDSDCVLVDSVARSSSDGPPVHAPSPSARAGAGEEAPASPHPCPGGNFLDNYPTRLEGRPWRADSDGSAWSCDVITWCVGKARVASASTLGNGRIW